MTMLKSTKRVANALNRMVQLTTTPMGLLKLNADSVGICSLINEYLHVECRRLSDDSLEETRWVWRSHMHELFREWPEFSGRESYPVPHQTRDAQQAYYYAGGPNMFGCTPYGEARVRLLKYLADRFQEIYHTLKSQPRGTPL